MPRGRCHFALTHALHARLHTELPVIARLVDKHLPDFVAGSLAPDALRWSLGRTSKPATHFYDENRRETWGQAVAEMFRANPDLAEPELLSDRDLAVLLGYVFHLTVDEAFRDVVTSRLHGVEDWLPIVRGLWSMIDEMEIGYSDLAGQIDRFDRQDRVGFIDCRAMRAFLDKVRPWASESDPWRTEEVFLDLIGCQEPVEQSILRMHENRARADAFFDDGWQEQFVEASLERGMTEFVCYLEGAYGQGAFRRAAA